jgi:hypothetical protein
MSEISKYGMPIEGLNEHETGSESKNESKEVEEKSSAQRNSLEEDSIHNFPDLPMDLEGNIRDNLSD